MDGWEGEQTFPAGDRLDLRFNLVLHCLLIGWG